MNKQNHTRFKTVSTLCLALCGLYSWYYCALEAPGSNASIFSERIATPLQTQYTLADEKHNLSFRFLAYLKPYCTPLYIVSIALIGIIIIRMVWFQYQYHYYTPQYEQILQSPHLEASPPPNTAGNTGKSSNAHNTYLIPKIKAMVEGKALYTHHVTSSDSLLLGKLMAGEKDVPYDLRKSWQTFRHQPQKIIIDMQRMYQDYKPFISLLFDPKPKNLLRLNQIATLFPNATEIICTEADRTGAKHTNHTPDIVNAQFILALKERLSNIGHNTKLKKVTITTYQNKIEDNCDLTSANGWHIGKRAYRIVCTQTPYMDCMAKVQTMIEGREPLPMVEGRASLDKVNTLDAHIFNQLVASSKEVPFDVLKKWNKLRYQPLKIIIDMRYMYEDYALFIPALFSDDEQPKNLLRLDTVAHLFPNATELICTYTDCIERKNIMQTIYSPDIVNTKFILGLQKRLSKIKHHTKLKKITIATYVNKIKDDFALTTFESFSKVGWGIGKAHKQIVLIKPFEAYVNDQFIPKIESMIAGQPLLYNQQMGPLDLFLFGKLVDNAPDIPRETQKVWHAFRHQPRKITIDIERMHTYYQALMPRLFSTDKKANKTLLLAQIATIFPNATEIACLAVDCTGWHADTCQYDYASTAGQAFIAGLQGILANKQHKLQKVMMTTYRAEIKDIYTRFDLSGWQAGKGSKTLVLAKHPYDRLAYNSLIVKMTAMIAGKFLREGEITPLDIAMFHKLTSSSLNLPSPAQSSKPSTKAIAIEVIKQWNAFRLQQASVHIDMKYMYSCYPLFIPVLFKTNSDEPNLLRLDKVVQIFPNATQIVCEKVDCMDDRWNSQTEQWGTYSPAVVGPRFIAAIKDMLGTIAQNQQPPNQLKKVVLHTYRNKIPDQLPLSPKNVGSLAWHMQKEHKYYPDGSFEHGTVTFTKGKAVDRRTLYHDSSYIEVS